VQLSGKNSKKSFDADLLGIETKLEGRVVELKAIRAQEGRLQ
jgi:hypothetical protein